MSRKTSSDRFIGSKNGAGVYQRIICWMPPHDLYVEPFAGTAAVFRHKRPAAQSILVDLDAAAIDALGGAVLSDTDGDGRPPPNVAMFVGDGLQLLAASQRWRRGGKRISALLESAEELFWFWRDPPERVLIYADPPYPRESRRDAQREYYRHDWTERQHRRFLNLILKLPFRVLVSSYYSQLYAEKLAGWHTDHFRVRTRGGTATEWLWANYPKPDRLHDYRYIGQGFADRWRIHKRQRSWVRLLRAMPPLERRAMLSHLREEFGEEILPNTAGDGRSTSDRGGGVGRPRRASRGHLGDG